MPPYNSTLLQLNQLKRAPQDYIQWIDYLNIEPASSFKNAIQEYYSNNNDLASHFKDQN